MPIDFARTDGDYSRSRKLFSWQVRAIRNWEPRFLADGYTKGEFVAEMAAMFGLTPGGIFSALKKSWKLD